MTKHENNCVLKVLKLLSSNQSNWRPAVVQAMIVPPIVTVLLSNLLFFKNGPALGIFFIYIVFSNTHYNFYIKKCEKCPSSIWCWDLNSQPLEYESPPKTTRPGLPPIYFTCLFTRWQQGMITPKLSTYCYVGVRVPT